MLLNRQYSIVYDRQILQLFAELYFCPEKNVRFDLTTDKDQNQDKKIKIFYCPSIDLESYF